jgi:hypothetical protein
MNTNLVRTPTAATAAAARSATAATATAPVPAETAPATAARRATSTRTASTSKRSASTALTRLGFINCKGRTSHILAVQSRYCGLGLVLIRHLDEAETPGPPGKIVLDDLCRIDITKAFESFTQFFLGGLCRQIPNVNVHVVFFSSGKDDAKPNRETLSPKAPTQAHANKLVILHKFGTGRHLPASTLTNGGN